MQKNFSGVSRIWKVLLKMNVIPSDTFHLKNCTIFLQETIADMKYTGNEKIQYQIIWNFKLKTNSNMTTKEENVQKSRYRQNLCGLAFCF